MGKPIDMTGQKHGRLTVIEMAGHNKHNQRLWRCVCDCGKDAEVLGFLLRQGQTQSCGCLHREVIASVSKTHGKSKSKIWSIHRSMMDRCYLPTSHAYGHYGGRGIYVCDRWHDFENFYADMGDKPVGMSLDRSDNNGPYSPENVRWANSKDQANNKRSNVVLEYLGRQQTMQQWCDELGLKISTVWARLNLYGYSVDKALTAGWRAKNA
jgi:hypothetical protein